MHSDRNLKSKEDGGAIYLTNNSVLTSTSTKLGYSSSGYENTAVDGGGIFCEDSTINSTNSFVRYNTASRYGGGIYLLNCTLNATNFTAKGNTASNHGGAIYADESEITLGTGTTNCTGNDCISYFEDNSVTSNSGGGALYSEDGSYTINQTSFTQNSGYLGGAIYQTHTGATSSGTINNTLFNSNTVSGPSGAAIRVYRGDFTLKHSTVAGNSGAPAVSSATPDNISIYNSIISNNSDGGFDGNITNSSCNIDQSGNVGTVINPLFVSLTDKDYHLQESSPAIDSCSTVGLSTDLEGKHRPIKGKYDMGAFEYGTYFPWCLILPVLMNSSR